ncbi:MAG: F0F1 ATP synthase subunit delta [Corynebacterium sp.]|nr:F0F1 ATP synthase subunit delta [Corynebacterium sp.]
MHAASREALEALTAEVSFSDVASAAQTGTELFEVVEALDGDRGLRIAVADQAAPVEKRMELLKTLFASRVSAATLAVLEKATAKNWSYPREYRAGLIILGRRAILSAAQLEGRLPQVEEELFRLSRLLCDEPQLVSLLSDRNAPAQKKRELFASVLYGKVTSFTEALALQVVGRPENNVIDDIEALSKFAAELQNRDIAKVRTSVALNEGQEKALAEKLGQIYGRAMSIHAEVDSSLLGGMIVHVGDEVIDGSISGMLAKMRARLA